MAWTSTIQHNQAGHERALATVREEAKEHAPSESKSAHTKKIMRELKKHVAVKGARAA